MFDPIVNCYQEHTINMMYLNNINKTINYNVKSLSVCKYNIFFNRFENCNVL